MTWSCVRVTSVSSGLCSCTDTQSGNRTGGAALANTGLRVICDESCFHGRGLIFPDLAPGGVWGADTAAFPKFWAVGGICGLVGGMTDAVGSPGPGELPPPCEPPVGTRAPLLTCTSRVMTAPGEERADGTKQPWPSSGPAPSNRSRKPAAFTPIFNKSYSSSV